jgi:hypothetical protein
LPRFCIPARGGAPRLPDDHFVRALQPGLLPTKLPGWLRTLSADGTAPTRTFTSVALFFDLDTSRTLTNADHYTTTSACSATP